MSKRLLTVTSCKAVKTGEGAKGPWTLYEVTATDAQGTEVDQRLNAFADLPLGIEFDYDVEERVHEKFGTSYTLKLPLEQRIKRLEQEVFANDADSAKPASSDDAKKVFEDSEEETVDDIPF